MTAYAHRTDKLPAPAHVVWADLVRPATTGSRIWLELEGNEVRPRVLESEEPHRVVWSSLWPDRPGDRVVIDLEPLPSDTRVMFTLMTDAEPPEESEGRRLRRRVSKLLFGELRESYGQ